MTETSRTQFSHGARDKLHVKIASVPRPRVPNNNRDIVFEERKGMFKAP